MPDGTISALVVRRGDEFISPALATSFAYSGNIGVSLTVTVAAPGYLTLEQTWNIHAPNDHHFRWDTFAGHAFSGPSPHQLRGIIAKQDVVLYRFRWRPFTDHAAGSYSVVRDGLTAHEYRVAFPYDTYFGAKPYHPGG